MIIVRAQVWKGSFHEVWTKWRVTVAGTRETSAAIVHSRRWCRLCVMWRYSAKPALYDALKWRATWKTSGFVQERRRWWAAPVLIDRPRQPSNARWLIFDVCWWPMFLILNLVVTSAKTPQPQPRAAAVRWSLVGRHVMFDVMCDSRQTSYCRISTLDRHLSPVGWGYEVIFVIPTTMGYLIWQWKWFKRPSFLPTLGR